MKKLYFKVRFIAGIGLLAACGMMHAASPIWTVIPLTNTRVAVPENATALVQYRVTNQSSKPHTLQMRAIQGVTQITDGLGMCQSSFTLPLKGASCVLSLKINGANLSDSVIGGPVLCQQGNPNQCYQPSQKAILQITRLPAVTIGQAFGGGIVACLDGGLQNLIAAKEDISVAIKWGLLNRIVNAQSNEDGAENTSKIVAALSTSDYAAKLCADYEIDSQGNTPCQAGNICYKDWFLPAKNQLNCLFNNLLIVGGDYWSSTESVSDPAMNAWYQDFYDGTQVDFDKDTPFAVRCVRALVT